MNNETNNIRLPAEWEPQGFLQLTWPHNNSDWGELLEDAVNCFTTIALTVAQFQPLLIVAPADMSLDYFNNYNTKYPIRITPIPSNDTWARDHGGITICNNNKLEVLDFNFNGWGLKFPANFDNLITTKLFQHNVFNEKVKYSNQLHFTLEGGSIESNGDGIILTNTQCLCSDNRNSWMTKSEIERTLQTTLGAEKVLWLNHGYLAGDDTDSHIDTLARFVNKDTIIYVQCTDPSDEHYVELLKMEGELKTLTDKKGNNFKLIPLPMAAPIYAKDGHRLPATYANFAIINNTVLVPTYNSSLDEVAINIIATCFPSRETIGIDCQVLIQQHGSLHCVTMQYPKGTYHE